MLACFLRFKLSLKEKALSGNLLNPPVCMYSGAVYP